MLMIPLKHNVGSECDPGNSPRERDLFPYVFFCFIGLVGRRACGPFGTFFSMFSYVFPCFFGL